MSDFLVVAIDFGTTFSGYAFSFLHEYNKDPLKISTCNKWNSSVGLFKKTSTCILFDPDKNFHSFGFKAEEKYDLLALENKHIDWYYFRRFKMMLYNNKGLNRGTQLEEENGKKLEAMKVFSESVFFLKNHFLKECKQKVTDISDSDIKWVITVPAIWNESSKQFMREAGQKAGIRNEQLMIVLEPEAASLYCMRLPVEKEYKNSIATFGVFKSGSKYMVVDAGGGTIDIIVHEVQNDGTLQELHKANGGNWGGTMVDSSFMRLLADIVGNDVIEEFISDNKYDLKSLLKDFEVKKRDIDPNSGNKVIFRIPASLRDIFCKINPENEGKTEMTLNTQFKSHVRWSHDKIFIDTELLKTIFAESCKKIVDHMQKLFTFPNLKNVPFILLVGGFAESQILQDAVRGAFNDKKVIIPKDAGLAVLKGAVLYRREAESISGRVCRYTYGIRIATNFDSSRHPKSKKVTYEGVEKCNDIFDIHVRMDDIIKLGENQAQKTYIVCLSNQTSLPFPIYYSTEREPTYTTDENCFYLGKLTLDLPDISKGIDRGANVHMIFGGTEITVTAVDKDDPKKTVSTNVDFLG